MNQFHKVNNKNSHKKNEVPIDFIDYNELKKRTNEFEH